jgi:hypothetical protein
MSSPGTMSRRPFPTARWFATEEKSPTAGERKPKTLAPMPRPAGFQKKKSLCKLLILEW